MRVAPRPMVSISALAPTSSRTTIIGLINVMSPITLDLTFTTSVGRVDTVANVIEIIRA